MKDTEIIAKIRNPLSKEQFLKEHPDIIERNVRCNFDDMVEDGRKLLEEKMLIDIAELEEWELDNLLDGQEDDTDDETVEPLYCNAVYNANKRKSNNTVNTSDLVVPEKFFTWTKLYQDSWISSKVEKYGYEAVKKLFEEDT